MHITIYRFLELSKVTGHGGYLILTRKLNNHNNLPVTVSLRYFYEGGKPVVVIL
jgi:hypothetical protein